MILRTDKTDPDYKGVKLGRDFANFSIVPIKVVKYPYFIVGIDGLSIAIKPEFENVGSLYTNDPKHWITPEDLQAAMEFTDYVEETGGNYFNVVNDLISSEYANLLFTGMLYEWIPEASGLLLKDVKLLKNWLFKTGEDSLNTVRRYLTRKGAETDDFQRGGFTFRNAMYPKSYEGMISPYLIDEVGQFPGHTLTEKAVKFAAEFIRKKDEIGESDKKVLLKSILYDPIHKPKLISYLKHFDLQSIKGCIELNIMQAQGYFVGEWKMEPETSGRRVLTKTGWKGVKNFVAKYPPESFTVTYNGVKYEIEDNAELFKKLFENEL
jgi:hypothetical protein